MYSFCSRVCERFTCMRLYFTKTSSAYTSSESLFPSAILNLTVSASFGTNFIRTVHTAGNLLQKQIRYKGTILETKVTGGKKHFPRMTDNHLVFMYGTVKKGEPNHSVLQTVTSGQMKYVGKARTVKKWPLVIASRYNIPYLLYVENKGKHVTGEVYEVDDAVLADLDELECHPKYYERTKEEVKLLEKCEKSTCNPWIYFLKKFKPDLLELPCLEEYSSRGPHGLQYVERYQRDGSNYYGDVMICEDL